MEDSLDLYTQEWEQFTVENATGQLCSEHLNLMHLGIVDYAKAPVLYLPYPIVVEMLRQFEKDSFWFQGKVVQVNEELINNIIGLPLTGDKINVMEEARYMGRESILQKLYPGCEEVDVWNKSNGFIINRIMNEGAKWAARILARSIAQELATRIEELELELDEVCEVIQHITRNIDKVVEGEEMRQSYFAKLTEMCSHLASRKVTLEESYCELLDIVDLEQWVSKEAIVLQQKEEISSLESKVLLEKESWLGGHIENKQLMERARTLVNRTEVILEDTLSFIGSSQSNIQELIPPICSLKLLSQEMNQVKLKMDHAVEECPLLVKRQTLLTSQDIERNNPAVVPIEERLEPLGDISFDPGDQNVLVSLTEQSERQSLGAFGREYDTEKVLFVSHFLNCLDVDKSYTSIGPSHNFEELTASVPLAPLSILPPGFLVPLTSLQAHHESSLDKTSDVECFEVAPSVTYSHSLIHSLYSKYQGKMSTVSMSLLLQQEVVSSRGRYGVRDLPLHLPVQHRCMLSEEVMRSK
eukprot:Gb_21137 [translate_table: standard]